MENVDPEIYHLEVMISRETEPARLRSFRNGIYGLHMPMV